MEDIFTQLKKANEVKMTNAERTAIRQNLMNISSGASSSMPQQNVSHVSPYMTPSPFSMFGMLTKAAVFVLVGFIIGGTSLSFASLQALPGDKLYAMKINVTEKIAESLAFSTEAKTRVEAARVMARVTEISTLRENGKLNDSHVNQIAEASFKTSFESYTTSLNTLSSEGRVARTKEIAQDTLIALKTIAPAPEIATPAMFDAKMAPVAVSARSIQPMMMTSLSTKTPKDLKNEASLDITLTDAVNQIESITESTTREIQEQSKESESTPTTNNVSNTQTTTGVTTPKTNPVKTPETKDVNQTTETETMLPVETEPTAQTTIDTTKEVHTIKR